jgi:hypothetical protein
MRTTLVIYLFIVLISLFLGIQLMMGTVAGIGTIILSVILASIIFQAVIISGSMLIIIIVLLFYQPFRKIINGDIKISLTTAEYLEENILGKIIIKWEQISQVYETDFYILFLISEENMSIIPMRVFNNNSDAHTFYIYAKKCWYNAHHPGNPI